MVDLPLPEGPTRKTNSPSLTSIVTPRSACVPFSYSFCTSVKRIIAVFSPFSPSLPILFYYTRAAKKWQ